MSPTSEQALGDEKVAYSVQISFLEDLVTSDLDASSFQQVIVNICPAIRYYQLRCRCKRE